MLVLGQAFVSPYLVKTAAELKIPVVKTSQHVPVPADRKLNWRSATSFFRTYKNRTAPLLSNSENALQAVENYLPDHPLAARNERFKSKTQFRKMLADLFPDFTYLTYSFDELMRLSPAKLPFPIVVKPAVGYASLGVYRVADARQWADVRVRLMRDVREARDLFPDTVLNVEQFIVEEWIEGEEYAIDGYINAQGEPVVLNVLKRMFAHAGDTSDRIYYTSKQVMQEAMEPVTHFMRQLAQLDDLRLYPMHLEVRISPTGTLVPIEVNPMRFAGIGTCDLAIHAYGENLYEHFFNQTKPDWKEILERQDDAVYSFFCAELPVELNTLKISAIDDEAFHSQFADVLEYRIMHRYDPTTFAVVFYRSVDLEENKRLLHLDLNQFISLRNMEVSA
ncbi:ATP-grasp domain-containing protein [Tumebacillus sp. BK434]|uniref:ATP-grasp domain-containing protein n=1 Tax=Tumebacillus sp. BK434 TaxID=2512169 RepID=UPI001053EFC0|nr:ATP-grasp domain-containing protein [Tumebacillus sp. BK434]TCP50170.1 ATP-grasp domain-containing protein [Tumebacillus sp. BK434]